MTKIPLLQHNENYNDEHEVNNLTKDGIDEDVKAYLKLGPDICETPKRIPYEKIIIEIEKMCKTIEDEI